MKCGRVECQNEAADGRYYCSRDCARLEDLGSRTQSKTAKYSIKADSDQSAESFEDGHGSRSNIKQSAQTQSSERPKQSVLQKSTQKMPQEGMSESESYMHSSPEKSESASPKHGWSDSEEMQKLNAQRDENGIIEMSKSIELKNDSDDGNATLPAASSQVQINFDEERYRSMNLIDESANHLLGYMKSLGTVKERPVMADFRQINAVANLSKQIASLAKVKLDAIKEARK